MFIGAIDQGTSSTRFILYNREGTPVKSHQVPITQHLDPAHPGWLEHDPLEIFNSVVECIESVMEDYSANDVAGVGITNQRETTVVWDRFTGEPLYNAIVWSDVRNSAVAGRYKQQLGVDYFRKSCGLPISTYFSAMKLRWLIENVESVRIAMEENRCFFGTVDSWLIWKLTGDVTSGVHVTHVSNASRTMLMDLRTLDWDEKTCKELGIPMYILPSIRGNSEKFGEIASGALSGVSICGCIGDQQSAALGQLCLNPGELKSTYGTGSFLLCNTGKEIVSSRAGLLTTIGCKLGNEDVTYALEGSIASAGSSVQWLRDNLNLIEKSSEMDSRFMSVPDNGGVYFVTAFSGLYAPYWRDDARATIVGMSQSTNKNHICRSIIEAVVYRTRDIVKAMSEDVGDSNFLKELRIDGGMSMSECMMQHLADILQVTVVRPGNIETTALGAAIAAGLAVPGFWRDKDEMIELISQQVKKVTPRMSSDVADEHYRQWHRAVERALGWIESDDASTVNHVKKWKRAGSLGMVSILCGVILTAFWMKRRH